MSGTSEINLYHAPGTRSDKTKMVLRLLSVSFNEIPMDLSNGDHKSLEYSRVNPFSQVPGLTIDGERVLDSTTQIIWLSDLFPQARLCPPPNASERKAYLEWMILIPASFEPPVRSLFQSPDNDTIRSEIDRSIKIQTELFVGPFCLGDELSSLDVVVHWSFRHLDNFGLLENHQIWSDYVDRLDGELDWASLNGGQIE